jgi:RsiW-degrading membrane proteinase PrsW (M82 family)
MAWPAGKLVFGDQFDTYLKEIGRSESEIRALDAETIAFRRDMAFSLPALSASLFLATLAPLTEEVFKYAALRITEQYFPQRTKTRRHYVIIAMAIGLGFALVENLAFIAAADSNSTQAQIAETIIERGIFGTSGHFLTATLTGCKYAGSRDSAKSDKSMWSIIKESLLYHGLGNLSLFTISTLYGHPGWVHPRDPVGIFACLACLIGVNAFAAWRVNTEIGRLDENTKRKVT